MNVRPEEFVGSREFARGTYEQVARLERGEVEKLIILNRNRPAFVVLTVERFDALVAEKETP